MKHLIVLGAFAGAALAVVGAPAQVRAQSANSNALATVHITKKVMADGKPLEAGTYQVRLSDQQVAAAAGESPDSERYVEFLKGGQVAGREVATVVSKDDIASIAKGKTPAPGTASVEMLQGSPYLRVWINKGGTNYLIHLPISS